MIRTLLVAVLLAAAPAASAPQTKAQATNACFDLTQMQDDKPLDGHTVLFRVGVNDIYALDFADTCPELTHPDPKLIIVPAGGITFICHALDLDIRVGENEPGEIPVPCIATGLRRLTAAEVAALPKRDVP